MIRAMSEDQQRKVAAGLETLLNIGEKENDRKGIILIEFPMQLPGLVSYLASIDDQDELAKILRYVADALEAWKTETKGPRQ